MYQRVTKSYLPSYLCDSSDGSDSSNSSDRSDSSDSRDGCDRIDQKTHKKLFLSKERKKFTKKVFHKKCFNQHLSFTKLNSEKKHFF